MLLWTSKFDTVKIECSKWGSKHLWWYIYFAGDSTFNILSDPYLPDTFWAQVESVEDA